MLTVVLGTGTLVELVDFILEAGVAQVDREQTCADLQARFGLSSGDAALAMDRTYGGIVRAKTEHQLNRPDPHSDPIAFASYERARRDPAIIGRLWPTAGPGAAT